MNRTVRGGYAQKSLLVTSDGEGEKAIAIPSGKTSVEAHYNAGLALRGAPTPTTWVKGKATFRVP